MQFGPAETFEELLRKIGTGLQEVNEHVQKLQEYGKDPARLSRTFSKASLTHLPSQSLPPTEELHAERKVNFHLRSTVSTVSEEDEGPVVRKKRPSFLQDLKEHAITSTKTLAQMSRQVSQHYVPRDPWTEHAEKGKNNDFQDFLENCVERYALRRDTSQGRQSIEESCFESEEAKCSCRSRCCCNKRAMIHPQSRRRLIWDSISVIMISLDMIMLPMIYGMNMEDMAEMLVLEWICTIFWSVDMAITFMTGYIRGPDVIMNPQKVACNYLRTWFIIDFTIVGSEWASRITEFVNGLNAFRAARAVRVLRVVRVVRLIRLARFVKTLHKFTEMTGSLRLLILFNVAKLTALLLLAVHIFSCGWHFVGFYTPGGWVEKENFLDQSVLVRYIAAVRWTLAQLNGRTDRQDRTFVEMSYVAFAACFTLIFMSIFVSSLTSRMLQLQQLMDKESGYKRLLQRYNEVHNLSWTTVYLARRHIEDRTNLESDMNLEKELLRLLPLQTQADLLSEVRFPLLVHHPLFRLLRGEFYSAMRNVLITAVKQEPTRHMETIFAKGSVCHQMYFVDGRKLVYSKDTGLKNWLAICGLDFELQTRSAANRMRNLLRGHRALQAQEGILSTYELSEGTYLCEASLWVDKWHNQGDFVSLAHSKLVAINSDAFAEAVAKHEDTLKLVSLYARNYVEMLRALADANQVRSDLLDSDLFTMLGVEKPESRPERAGSIDSSQRLSWARTSLVNVLKGSAPFLRGASGSSDSEFGQVISFTSSSKSSLDLGPAHDFQARPSRMTTILSEDMEDYRRADKEDGKPSSAGGLGTEVCLEEPWRVSL
ncbi:unnamed protein product [Effrenium voratum]|uniref:Ion transport domain-containing protein n=2 Tax=Effrenium voratum TaxID=2562239 RepID=A0AA36HZQ2_9DINO|nr:unnamed protein product [Effrenium voratum]CAJ1440314.1 unnamed protein product [Effrenium voratum]